MLGLLAWSAGVLSQVGCADGGGDGGGGAPPASLITDQANGPGNPGFYWVPPIVTTNVPGTTLDTTAAASGLTIWIDRLYPDGALGNGHKVVATGAAITTVAGLSSPAFPGVPGPFYGYNWTPGAAVAVGQRYRISVRLEGMTPPRVLGVADVRVLATASDPIDRTKETPLVINGTLRVVFRIVNRDVDGDAINDWKDNCPLTSNGNQLDTNADGRGDACQCLNAGNGTPCATPCKTGQTCNAGVCSGGSPLAPGASCKSGTACRQNETCSSSGTCGGGSFAAPGTACPNANPCKTGGACISGGVCATSGFRASGTPCATGNLCRTGETCDGAGVCGNGSNLPINTPCSTTGNQCTSGQVCAAGGTCVGTAAPKPNGTACSDGNLCSPADTCQAGVCTGGTAVVCPTDTCHPSNTCNRDTGACAPFAADGVACTTPEAAPGTCDGGAGVCAPLPLACPGQATTFGGAPWCSIDIYPRFFMVPGTTSTTASAVTLGAKAGVVPTYYEDPDGQRGADSMRYFYRRVDGDFEIKVRVAAASVDAPFGKRAGVQAGVMIRDAANPADGRALSGAAWVTHLQGFDPANCADPNELINVGGAANRRTLQGEALIDITGGTALTRAAAPFWLRLRRMGKDYSITRSRDGITWVPMAGGVMAAPQAVVGVFVGGMYIAEGLYQQTATFDNITVTPVSTPEYRTSWMGSSFAADSTEVVTLGNSNFYVAPDGTSYKVSTTVDNGSNMNAIRFTGSGSAQAPALVQLTGNWFWGIQRGGITGDGTYVYIAKRSGPESNAEFWVERRRTIASGDLVYDGRFPACPQGEMTCNGLGLGIGQIDGLAARNATLYVSDRDANRIRVVDWTAAAPAEQTGFAFDRPGPLAVDNGGQLWIVQTSLPYPGPFEVTPPVLCTPTPPQCIAPRIVCKTPSGGSCGVPDIISVANPVALAISPNPGNTVDGSPPPNPINDQLIVTDAGSNQNLRLCTQLHGTPSCATEIGAHGGALASPVPGTATGTSLRLFAPIGAGVDRSGNLYVADGAPNTEVSKLAGMNGSSVVGHLYGLGPDPGAFDPDSDGREFYTANRHFGFDPSKTAPGSEWSSKAVNRHPFEGRPADARTGVDLAGHVVHHQPPFVRTLGGTRYMFLPYYNTSPEVGLQFFRFQGEIARLWGALFRQGTNLALWIDADNDGKPEDDGSETTTTALPNGSTFQTSVDRDGNIWLTLDTWAPAIWKLVRNPTAGATPYSLVPPNRIEYTMPDEFRNNRQDPLMAARYDAAANTMFLFGNGPGHPDGCTPSTSRLMNTIIVARYDNWPQTSTLKKVQLPTPLPDAQDDFADHVTDVLCGCVPDSDWPYNTFDVAGDMIFVGQHRGPIHVYRASDLTRVTTLPAGPEVNGVVLWYDNVDLMRAVRRSTGEYLITMTGTDRRAANFVIRWTPPPAP